MSRASSQPTRLPLQGYALRGAKSRRSSAQCRRLFDGLLFLSHAHCRQETAINHSISWKTVSAFVDPDRITSAWTDYAIDRAAIIAGAGEPFLHPRNNRSAIDAPVGVVGIVTAVSVRIISVTVWRSPIRGTAVVRVSAVIRITAVIRVATVVPPIKRNAYSDIPKYAATTAPVTTAPVVSVIASVRHQRLAIPRLDNACLGKRGRRQRKRDNGTKN
jgi:hypothetical protein